MLPFSHLSFFLSHLVKTKPPENPHHHTATTPKPSNSIGSQNPTTSTIHKHKHKQSIIQNKHKQSSTNQAKGLNNPKAETQQTLNRSEQPNRQADLQPTVKQTSIHKHGKPSLCSPSPSWVSSPPFVGLRSALRGPLQSWVFARWERSWDERILRWVRKKLRA